MDKIVKIIILSPIRRISGSGSDLVDINRAIKKAARLPYRGILHDSGKILTIKVCAN